MKQWNNVSIKVKDGQGNWVAIPGIAGESAYEIAVRNGTFTGTEQQWLNALETERAAAVASIQTKGTQTLASIPNDYATLSDEVSQLSAEYTDETLWAIGTISASTGSNATSTTRIRVASVFGDEIQGVRLTSGYEALVYAYDDNGTYVGNWNGEQYIKVTTGNIWFPGTIKFKEISRTYKFKVVVKRTDGNDISVSESSNVAILTNKPMKNETQFKNTMGFKEYDDQNGTYKIGDVVIHEGRLHSCFVDILTPEPWNINKWRDTTVNQEIENVKNAIMPDSSTVDTDMDCVYFPLRFAYGRVVASTGERREENTPAVYRRVMTDLISTDQIDAVCINGTSYYTFYFVLYDNTKTFIKSVNISNNYLLLVPDEKKFISVPKDVGYISVNLVLYPDEAPYTFDISKLSKEMYGVKFLMTEKYNRETNCIETILPVGIGNYISGGMETFDYGTYRMRTGILQTAKYTHILVDDADELFDYKVNIRYVDDNGESHDATEISTGGLYPIERTQDRFRIQIYNNIDANTTPMSPVHARKHIKLICDLNQPSNIIQLNDVVKTTERLQQMTTCYNAPTPLPVQPLVLLHCSDIHNKTEALKRIIEFKNYYSEYIDDVVHTGDNVGSINTAHTFGSISGAEAILNVVGNHDTWRGSGYSTYNDWHYLTEAETYGRYFSDFITNWGDIQITSDHCYYYKDYTEKNVRLIVLDCMHPTADQLTWFTNTLTSAKTAGLHVVIADHVLMAQAENLTYLDESGFCSPSTPRTNSSTTQYPNFESSDYANAVADFTENGGFVACWLCGHRHVDTLAKYNGVLNVAVTTAGDISSSRTYDRRVVGTKSFDAFNLVGIDTARKHVYISRVGLEYNESLGKMDTLCWDYANSRLIHTS